MKWLHKLLNPHCEHCLEEAREARICTSCELLTRQLELAQFEKKQLLQKLLNPTQPEPVKEELEPPQPIFGGNVSWTVRREQLELRDKELAATKALEQTRQNEIRALMSKTSTEELEKELDIKHG